MKLRPADPDRTETIDTDDPSASSDAKWVLLVALAMGMAWGAWVAWTGSKTTWLVVVAALVLVWAWRRAVPDPPDNARWLVLLLTLGTAVAAWGTAALIGRTVVLPRQVEPDSALLPSAAAYYFYAHDELPGQNSNGQTSPTPDDEPTGSDLNSAAIDDDLWVQEQLLFMSEAQKRKILAWYLEQPGGQAVRQATDSIDFGLTDPLWLIAGCWLAFRLSGPRGDGNDD